MVSPKDLPGFWKFVWRASPLTYLIAGLSLAGLSHADITCSDTQVLIINPPSGTTCGNYLDPYVQSAGGAVMNPAASTSCQYCPISNANAVIHGSLGIGWENPWYNAGYFAVFVIFNVISTFALYWVIRVHGKRG